MRSWYLILVYGLFLGFMLGGCFSVSGADEDLIERFAPIYQFTDGECCYPVEIEYFISNARLYEYQDSGSIVRDNDPTSSSLGTAGTQDYYLDHTKGTITDLGIITDYQNSLSSLGYTVYGRVYDEGSIQVIQYWMFYAFNKGSLNVHEGDWEMVQITVEDLEPSQVMFSQHHGGQKATWEQVEHEGDHIIVYVAEGTHANYFRSFSGRFGVANDVVGSDGRRLSNADYGLELLEDQEWLDFAGYWGYYGGPEDELRGKTGPHGPRFRESGEIWISPSVWGASLAQVDNNIFLVEWFLANFLWIFVLITVLSFVFIMLRIYHKHLNYGLGPRKISILYISGFDRKSIGNILIILGIVLALGALVNQWYVLSADIKVPGHESGGFVDLISIDGLDGVQVNVLDPTIGITPLSVFILPFSLIIFIGVVFFILGTIGVASSKKLGRKYMSKGVRLLLPIILILVVFLIVGNMVDFSDIAGVESSAVTNILADLSAAPWAGGSTYGIPEYQDSPASVSVQWGIGLGGWLLVSAGIIMILGGFLESSAKVDFFKPKTIDDTISIWASREKKKKQEEDENVKDFVEEEE